MQLEFISRYIVSIEERKGKRYIVSGSPIVSRVFGFPLRVAYTGWESMGLTNSHKLDGEMLEFTDCRLFPHRGFSFTIITDKIYYIKKMFASYNRGGGTL